MQEFHQARLSDEYAYLFWDGVSLRMRLPGGRKRTHMFVATAYGTAPAICVGFYAQPGREPGRLGRSAGGSLPPGSKGKKLLLIFTDGCPGLAAAIQTVYHVDSVDRIIHASFQSLNLEWKNRTLKLFSQAA